MSQMATSESLNCCSLDIIVVFVKCQCDIKIFILSLQHSQCYLFHLCFDITRDVINWLHYLVIFVKCYGIDSAARSKVFLAQV